MAHDPVADYACDKCRARKIACSRTQPACQRCFQEGFQCTYSRHGVIRRHRRRKNELSLTTETTQTTPGSSSYGSSLSHLETDIAHTQLELEHNANVRDPSTQSVLERLADTSAAVWLNSGDFIESEPRMAKQKFVIFEEHMDAWTDLFLETLTRGEPMFFGPPDHVIDHLRQARPHRIKERAWLVTFYSIILSSFTSSEPDNSSIKNKLISNLWLALNDARLLLEPTEAGIQALVLLAVHVEEFTSPALSWTLVTSACRMLQAIGVTQRRLQPHVRERRIMLFWYLNVLDKGLAVVFTRPPTFHRAMSQEIPIPRTEQLLAFRPHLRAGSTTPGLFGTHYLSQMMLLTSITGDVWTCLYEDLMVDAQEVMVLLGRLDAWFESAMKILHAAATSEMPFLDASSTTSINIGLVMPTFQHSYLTLLLARSSPDLRSRGLEAAKKLLSTLKSLVSDSQEVYNGIVWHLVCCPFTAFLTLYGEVVSGRIITTQDERSALTDMQQLPAYLAKMAEKNSLAAKLRPIAETLMKHARDRSEARALDRPNHVISPVSVSSENPIDAGKRREQFQLLDAGFASHFLEWNKFLDQDQLLPFQSAANLDHPFGNADLALGGQITDPMVDWLSWD